MFSENVCPSVKSQSANEVEPEPHPQPRLFEPNTKKNKSQNIADNVKDINFYKGVFCSILLSERVSEKEGEILFMKNIQSLMKMREFNSDKLACLVRGGQVEFMGEKVSDDEIFQYVVNRLIKAKKHGHIIDAAIAYSI